MRYVGLTAVSLFVLLAGDEARGAGERQVRLSVLGSMERIGQDQEPFGLAEVKIQAARNEVESFQVVVTAGGANLGETK